MTLGYPTPNPGAGRGTVLAIFDAEREELF